MLSPQGMGVNHGVRLRQMPVRIIIVVARNDQPTVISQACKTGGFYQAPSNQETVDSLQPLEIKWDNSCLDTAKADIYLYAPSAPRSRLAVWENVDFTTSFVSVDLMPRWWNATASIHLQLGIVPAGQAPFQSSQLPAGPIFTATYTPPSSGKVPAAADVSLTTSPVINMDQKAQSQSNHGMTAGKTAAAVLTPLLVVIAIAVAYVHWQRKKAGTRSELFTTKVDQRMSTISTNWKSITAAGANAAIRNSIATGNRSSSFSFGAIRPASIIDPDDNQAGIGAARQMSQMRTGVGLRNPNSIPSERVSLAESVTRQSRVSFANDVRPSMDSGIQKTRAYHEGHVPPVPTLPPSATLAGASPDDSPTFLDDSVQLSPRQTSGPLTLTPEDIRARIQVGSRARSISNVSAPIKGEDCDDVFPALSST